MARHHRGSLLRGRVLFWTCCWCDLFLLRHSGAGVVAQTSSGGDDASVNSDCETSSSGMIGDALCDFDLNVAACGFDGGDCCECTCIDTDEQACGEGGAGYFCLDPDASQDCGATGTPAPSISSSETSSTSSSDTSTTYPGCGGYLPHMGDGFCDEALNNAACGFDGGDCCACTCGAGASTGTDSPEHPCGYRGDGFDCRDPDVPSDCGSTPSPAASFGYPDCTGYMYDWQDSYCDSDLNNAACGYDGGDCCRCTCREYSSWSTTCGYYGFDCMDPDAPSTCSTDSPTPSPAAGTDYPQCEGVIYGIGDSYCQSYNNNEACDWDGGDCCPCTCEDSSLSSSPCGYYGYDCLDPTVGAECSPAPTPSPTLAPYPDCLGVISNINDGDCDNYNNNEECGWDGGDCCPCTCEGSGSLYTLCGSIFDCLDPTVSTDCIATSFQYTSTYTNYDRSIAAIPVDQQEAWASGTSESSFTLFEKVRFFVLAAVGFGMLWCGLSAACALARRTFFEDEDDDATKTARTYSVRPGGRPARPSGERLAASSAASSAIPPAGIDQASMQGFGTAGQIPLRGVRARAEESKGEEKVELDAEFYGRDGDSGWVGEVKREDPGEGRGDGRQGHTAGRFRGVTADANAADAEDVGEDGGASEASDVAADAGPAPDPDAAASPPVVVDGDPLGAANDVMPRHDEDPARSDVDAGAAAGDAGDDDVGTPSDDEAVGGGGATGNEEENAHETTKETSSSSSSSSSAQPSEGLEAAGSDAKEEKPPGGDAAVDDEDCSARLAADGSS